MTEFKQAPVVGSKRVDAGAPGTKAKVYFTRSIDAEHLIKLYNLVNENIYGKVAIKLHTGEKHAPGYGAGVPGYGSRQRYRGNEHVVSG